MSSAFLDNSLDQILNIRGVTWQILCNFTIKFFNDIAKIKVLFENYSHSSSTLPYKSNRTYSKN